MNAGHDRLAAQECLELQDVLGKLVRPSQVAPHCPRRVLVAAGRASESEIDASGVKFCEGTKLLRDTERRVIREHYATGAQTHGGGAICDVADKHAGGG